MLILHCSTPKPISTKYSIICCNSVIFTQTISP